VGLVQPATSYPETGSCAAAVVVTGGGTAFPGHLASAVGVAVDRKRPRPMAAAGGAGAWVAALAAAAPRPSARVAAPAALADAMTALRAMLRSIQSLISTFPGGQAVPGPCLDRHRFTIAQSAAVALRAAGAGTSRSWVLGRHLSPGGPGSAGGQRFSLEHCVVHRAGLAQ